MLQPLTMKEQGLSAAVYTLNIKPTFDGYAGYPIFPELEHLNPRSVAATLALVTLPSQTP